MAALGAIVASAVAGAMAPTPTPPRSKAPVSRRSRPRTSSSARRSRSGARTSVRGRYKNTVVFKRDARRPCSSRPRSARRSCIRVTVSERLDRQLLVAGRHADRRRRSACASSPRSFGKKFTRGALVAARRAGAAAGPETPAEGKPDGDCDRDKVNEQGRRRRRQRPAARRDRGRAQDATRARRTPTATASTDGYEFQSARDLNDDEYQEPQTILPAPEKRPYPNPLYGDASVDYDGDSLTLGQEYSLWKATATRRPASTTSSTPTATSTRPTAATAPAAAPAA